MATSSDACPGTLPPTAPAQEATSPVPASSAVEMSDLSSPTAAAEENTHQDTQVDAPPPSEPSPSALPATHAAQADPTSPPEPLGGLGPASDLPIGAPITSSLTASPALAITLMLTTGARHPYRIDEKYLKNRKVEAEAHDGTFDPREISGYQLKELIWTDWRSEWEPRPASPSSIRLIILGRLLEDKSPLKDFPFKLDNPNVVHMTVKPADFLDDDEPGAKGTGKGQSLRGRDGEDRGAGCRCVIL